ncbi:unnamed protein product [Owenia fusiformis]|uniref:Uncharacterized protein n=1 Tax=Owenia fusiformis TaxID=6347 RepID=A0A8J1Y310_OWEFU|nr:unnamed protein product [Owenia fusiformis]
MAMKQQLTLWSEGVDLHEANNFDSGLEKWKQIQNPSAKILFNIANVQIQFKQLEQAAESLSGCVEKDEHLAVGYFLRGVVYFKTNRFPDALRDFEAAHKKLREKDVIDYKQLGLRHKLYACECLHNQALVHLYQQDVAKARQLLGEAQNLKVEKKHSVCDTALSKAANNEAFPLIEIPSDALFKPPKSVINNMAKKDYLGKAKVISAVCENDRFSGFDGPRLIEEGKVADKIGNFPQLPKRIVKSPDLTRKLLNQMKGLILDKDETKKIDSQNTIKASDLTFSGTHSLPRNMSASINSSSFANIPPPEPMKSDGPSPPTRRQPPPSPPSSRTSGVYQNEPSETYTMPRHSPPNVPVSTVAIAPSHKARRPPPPIPGDTPAPSGAKPPLPGTKPALPSESKSMDSKVNIQHTNASPLPQGNPIPDLPPPRSSMLGVMEEDTPPPARPTCPKPLSKPPSRPPPRAPVQ